MDSDEFARRILKRAARENTKEPVVEIGGKSYPVGQLEALQADGLLGQWGPFSEQYLEQFIYAVRHPGAGIVLLNWPGPEVEIHDYWPPADLQPAHINIRSVPGRVWPPTNLIINGVMSSDESESLAVLP